MGEEIIDEGIFEEDVIVDVVVEDEPAAIDIPDLPAKLIRVKFLHSNETEFCEYPQTFTVNHKDYVIATSKYGKDFARVLGSYILNSEKEKLTKLRSIQTIIRKATDDDVEKYNQNLEKAKEAFNICKEKIQNHKLDMKLVSAYYLFDEPKVLFFFTADTRVDFRELVKDLVTVFKIRIELRQIGVRDESRVIGGLGVCGRDYCCHGLTDKLNPVSIKMAKDQNLSLNSMKISGICGRLLCCLSYEYDFYQEERNKFPAEGTKIFAGERIFRVIEINVLTKTVRMEGPDNIVINANLKQLEFNDKKYSWHYIDS
ncbi:MAG: stage 0 sporulation family protein [Endomicrobium sp.]|jgi:cell fate regulator YaaT (PSP1 superfamily)|nr:stage 0 sporulation family protein [Endomicrobium sp.]